MSDNRIRGPSQARQGSRKAPSIPRSKATVHVPFGRHREPRAIQEVAQASRLGAQARGLCHPDQPHAWAEIARHHVAADVPRLLGNPAVGQPAVTCSGKACLAITRATKVLGRWPAGLPFWRRPLPVSQGARGGIPRSANGGLRQPPGAGETPALPAGPGILTEAR